MRDEWKTPPDDDWWMKIEFFSDAHFEHLLDLIEREQKRRQRKREKQAVKDAMNMEPKT